MKPAFPVIVRSFAAALILLSAGCAELPFNLASPFHPASPAPQERAAPVGAPGSPEAKAELALQLAAQARRDRDARAMLVATRLLLTSGTRPARLLDGNLQPEAGTDPVAAGWAEEAIVLADGDDEVRAEAEALLAMRPRGVMRSSLGTGPLRYVQRIATYETVEITISTQPQAAARVAAIGDGDALIGLTVTAPGQRICEEEARTTHSLCAWEALSDRHAVRLTNRGPLDSDVMLLSN